MVVRREEERRKKEGRRRWVTQVVERKKDEDKELKGPPTGGIGKVRRLGGEEEWTTKLERREEE